MQTEKANTAIPAVPPELVLALGDILVLFGFGPEEAVAMLSTWMGWPIAATLANYSAKIAPAMKKKGFTVKADLMRLAVPCCPPGLGWDITEQAYRWRVPEFGAQFGFHSLSTRGSENLPADTWDGVRWQNEEQIQKLVKMWTRRRLAEKIQRLANRAKDLVLEATASTDAGEVERQISTINMELVELQHRYDDIVV